MADKVFQYAEEPTSVINLSLNTREPESDQTLDPDFTRNVPYPPELFKELPMWEVSIKIAMYALIMAIAFIGNSLVICIVLRNKRMWTTTNYYLVNLAVSDLMVTFSCMWVHLVDDITEGWVLGAFFCRFNSFAQVLSLVSSIMTLTLISCDRFFGIVFAMKAHLTRRRARTLIVAVWVYSLATSAPLLAFRDQFMRIWANHVEIWCDDTWPAVTQWDPQRNMTLATHPSKKIYYTFVCLVLYFLPITIMSFAYGCIACKLWHNSMPGEHVHSEVSVRDRNRRKIIGMLVAIVFTFALCWLPFQIGIIYAQYRQGEEYLLPLPDWYDPFMYFSVFMANANSAFNPVIYTCFNDNYRRGFKQLACCFSRQHRRLMGSPEIQRDASYRSTSRSTRIMLSRLPSYDADTL